MRRRRSLWSCSTLFRGGRVPARLKAAWPTPAHLGPGGSRPLPWAMRGPGRYIVARPSFGLPSSLGMVATGGDHRQSFYRHSGPSGGLRAGRAASAVFLLAPAPRSTTGHARGRYSSMVGAAALCRLVISDRSLVLARAPPSRSPTVWGAARAVCSAGLSTEGGRGLPGAILWRPRGPLI